jgi:hypothetical protein
MLRIQRVSQKRSELSYGRVLHIRQHHDHIPVFGEAKNERAEPRIRTLVFDPRVSISVPRYEPPRPVKRAPGLHSMRARCRMHLADCRQSCSLNSRGEPSEGWP